MKCNQETDSFPTSCRKVKGGKSWLDWKKTADTPSSKMNVPAASVSDFQIENPIVILTQKTGFLQCFSSLSLKKKG